MSEEENGMSPGSRGTKLIAVILVLATILVLSCCDLFGGRISWLTKSALQFPRIDLGVAVAGGRIYAIGGYTDQTVAYVEEYDPVGDSWTRKTDMPTARRCFAIGTIEGRIYVTGGMSFTDPNSVTYVYSTEIYDPAMDSWSAGTDLPMVPPFNSVFGNAHIAGTVAMDSVLGRDTLYVAIFNTEETDSSAMWSYDPLVDAWSEKEGPPVLNRFEEFSVVTSGSGIFLYCCGDLAEYRMESGQWTSTKLISMERYAASACALDSRIYVLGGAQYYGDLFREIEKFDPETGGWYILGNMPTPRLFCATAELGGSLYAIGGTFSRTRFQPYPLSLVEEVRGLY